jgi:hypothetical protein
MTVSLQFGLTIAGRSVVIRANVIPVVGPASVFITSVIRRSVKTVSVAVMPKVSMSTLS